MGVDLTQLKMAVSDADGLMDGSEVESLHDLVGAARGLLQGETIWWCKEHNAEQLTIDHDSGELRCWKAWGKFLSVFGAYSPCRLVAGVFVEVNE